MSTDMETIEETIGQRMRYRREVLGLTQKEVGRRVEEHLGRAWSPQAVSIAESGGRDFRAVDLVAIAQVLETTPNFLTDWDYSIDADTLSTPNNSSIVISVNTDDFTKAAAEMEREIERLWPLMEGLPPFEVGELEELIWHWPVWMLLLFSIGGGLVALVAFLIIGAVLS